MNAPFIFIVIPVHNRKEVTRRCLEALARQSFRGFKSIVVDDGSSDGTAEMIRTEFPAVTVVPGNGNLWWTGAVNQGIRHALTQAGNDDVVLLLNDDLIVRSDYVQTLVGLSGRKPRCIVGSVEVCAGTPDLIANGGVRINWITARHTNVNQGARLSAFAPGHTEPVSIHNGRGVLYPVSVFREIGLFDDAHFKQCGDTEFSRRANLRGYDLVMSYDAVVTTVDTGHGLNNATGYSLSDARRYFFDIRSNYRLSYRWHFSRNTARSIMGGILYFACDVVRVSWHFFSRVSFRRTEGGGSR